MRRYWLLLVPLAMLPWLMPSYLKLSRELEPGPAEVRQLTFDRGTSDQVINEFAVASPDGKYFVVQHSEDPKLVTRADGSRALDFKETSNWDIYRYRTDGSERLRLTDEPTSEDQPTWSPDSRTIVYRKRNGESFDLYLMDADGGNKRPLLIDPDHDEKTPAFSRDGKRVVFFSDRDGIQWNLYTIDVETRQVVRLTQDHAEDKHPQFTPRGDVVFHSNRGSRRVVLEGGEEFDLMNLWKLDAVTHELTELTSSDDSRDNRHAWISPDGQLVAYHSNIIEPLRRHRDLHRKTHRELCITTVDGQHRINLTHGDPRNFKHPTWAADGKGLFFVFKDKKHAWNAGFMDVSDAVQRLRSAAQPPP